MKFSGDYPYRVRVTRYPDGASQSTVNKRADLIESFGATAVVERSGRITWPEPNEKE